MRVSRALLRHLGAALPLLLLPPRTALSADDSLSTAVRRAVVRSAQIADSADAVWQQVAGEVTPPWQPPQPLDPQSTPASLLDADFAILCLQLPLEAGASCCAVRAELLAAMLPAARREAVLLYGAGGGGAAGTAQRGFSREVSSAVDTGGKRTLSNPAVFGFEAFVTWRVLQRVLSLDQPSPAQRRQLQRCFSQKLGSAMLRGPLRPASSPPLHWVGAVASPALPPPQRATSLREALAGCDALLQCMRRGGLLARFTLLSPDAIDDEAWQAGDGLTWQYDVRGSPLVGASQLAQERTVATGQGGGLYPGLLVTAPLRQYLLEAHAVDALIEEYFLDNRIGRPDPRTFADPSYYTDLLLEVVVPRRVGPS
jgi:hypothetical protein